MHVQGTKKKKKKKWLVGLEGKEGNKKREVESGKNSARYTDSSWGLNRLIYVKAFQGKL